MSGVFLCSREVFSFLANDQDVAVEIDDLEL